MVVHLPVEDQVLDRLPLCRLGEDVAPGRKVGEDVRLILQERPVAVQVELQPRIRVGAHPVEHLRVHDPETAQRGHPHAVRPVDRLDAIEDLDAVLQEPVVPFQVDRNDGQGDEGHDHQRHTDPHGPTQATSTAPAFVVSRHVPSLAGIGTP